MFEQTPGTREGVGHAGIWGTGTGMCKGPGVRACLACLRSSQEASQWGSGQVEAREAPVTRKDFGLYSEQDVQHPQKKTLKWESTHPIRQPTMVPYEKQG